MSRNAPSRSVQWDWLPTAAEADPRKEMKNYVRIKQIITTGYQQLR